MAAEKNQIQKNQEIAKKIKKPAKNRLKTIIIDKALAPEGDFQYPWWNEFQEFIQERGLPLIFAAETGIFLSQRMLFYHIGTGNARKKGGSNEMNEIIKSIEAAQLKDVGGM